MRGGSSPPSVSSFDDRCLIFGCFSKHVWVNSYGLVDRIADDAKAGFTRLGVSGLRACFLTLRPDC